MVFNLLTDRQGQILRLLCDGKTVREVAESLSTSVNNVNGQRSSIKTRLGGRTFEEICHLVDEGGDATVRPQAARS